MERTAASNCSPLRFRTIAWNIADLNVLSRHFEPAALFVAKYPSGNVQNAKMNPTYRRGTKAA
jgi:hypothetical protein